MLSVSSRRHARRSRGVLRVLLHRPLRLWSVRSGACASQFQFPAHAAVRSAAAAGRWPAVCARLSVPSASPAQFFMGYTLKSGNHWFLGVSKAPRAPLSLRAAVAPVRRPLRRSLRGALALASAAPPDAGGGRRVGDGVLLRGRNLCGVPLLLRCKGAAAPTQHSPHSLPPLLFAFQPLLPPTPRPALAATGDVMVGEKG